MLFSRFSRHRSISTMKTNNSFFHSFPKLFTGLKSIQSNAWRVALSIALYSSCTWARVLGNDNGMSLSIKSHINPGFSWSQVWPESGWRYEHFRPTSFPLIPPKSPLTHRPLFNCILVDNNSLAWSFLHHIQTEFPPLHLSQSPGLLNFIRFSNAPPLGIVNFPWQLSK